MSTKLWTEEAFCHVDRYTCLMPVEYESDGEDVIKNYTKKRMACRHALSGECSLGNECEFFKKAPEILDKNSPWFER